MGIFNPFISSCEHDRNLDWILKRVKGMPQKEEMESALEEARAIGERANGLVEKVESIIDDATAAAKLEIKGDLSTSMNRIEDAERNTIAKATQVQTAIDNATYNVMQEVYNFVNEHLNTISNLASAVHEDAGYVEQVVEDAATALKNLISSDIETSFTQSKNELYSYVSGDLWDEFMEVTNSEIGKAFQQIQNHNNEAFRVLTEEVMPQHFQNSVDELEAHADEYIPHAVANAVAQRFVTCGVFVPVSAWNNKTARVNAGMDVDKTTLFVTYSPSSFNDWFDNGVRCTLAEGTYLEFECATVPTAELYVYVVAVENMVVED